MIDETPRIVCALLCQDDRGNALALGEALKWQSTCDEFVVIGKSIFIEDYFKCPHGYTASFAETYDWTKKNAMVFEAEKMLSVVDSSYAENIYQYMATMIERVRTWEKSHTG